MTWSAYLPGDHAAGGCFAVVLAPASASLRAARTSLGWVASCRLAGSVSSSSPTTSAILAAGFTVTAAPPPALAQEQDVTDILGGLGQWATFSKDLAPVGALGQQLPLVQLVPTGANALDFGTAFKKALVDPLSGKNTLGDLDGTYSPSFGDSRTGSLQVATNKAGNAETVTTDVTVERDVARPSSMSARCRPRVDLSVPGQRAPDDDLAPRVDLRHRAPRPSPSSATGRSPSLHVPTHASLAPSGDAAIGDHGRHRAAQLHVHAGRRPCHRGRRPERRRSPRLHRSRAGAPASSPPTAPPRGCSTRPWARPPGAASGHIDVVTKPLTGFSASGLGASVAVCWPDVSTGARR